LALLTAASTKDHISIELLEAARSDSRLPSGVFQTLLLYFFAQQTSDSWPNSETMARKKDCGVATIERHNQKLVDIGYIPSRFGKKKSGFVYLLRGGGYCKIGQAKQIKQRLAQISPKLPFPVELAHAIKTNNRYWLEGHLHVLFAKKHTNGEWFRLDTQDIQFLMNYNEWNVDQSHEEEVNIS